MKLSNETISVLKNFSAINQGMLFKPGKTLKTVSSHKNILAQVDIKEDIPFEFGIYDLNNFLSVISLHTDSSSFEFSDKELVIVGNKGRSRDTYRFTPVNMIVTPPDKPLLMGDPEIKFDLSAEDFSWVLRAASVFASPQIGIKSDGKKIFIVTFDSQNDSAHTDSLEIAEGNGDKYKMVFKTENITKVMSGSYEVSIASKGISHFKNKNLPLQYWITTEQGSKFEKG